MALLRGKATGQAARWRGVVQRAVLVAVGLALLQSMLYRAFYQGEQQQQQQQHAPGVYSLTIAGHEVTLSVDQPEQEPGGHSDSSASAAADGGGASTTTDGDPEVPGSSSRGSSSDSDAEATSDGGEAQQPEVPADGGGSSGSSDGSNDSSSGTSSGTSTTTSSSGISTAGLACEEGGMCSAGKVKRWWGEITTTEQLRGMLEGLAYKKEIIMVTSGMEALPSAVNIVEDARSLGMEHIFVLVWDESFCNAIPDSLKPRVSCAWDMRRSLESVGIFWGQMAKRWEFVARALRMGYNILSLDSDVALLDDPYRYLKAPALSKYSALFHRDGVGFNNINCGVMYWQNCHPAGPLTFMAVELADRTLRQREDPAAMKETFLSDWDISAHTWEQNMWNDMLHGASQGRPVTVLPGEANLGKEFFKENLDHNFAATDRWKRIWVEWPEAWKKRTLYSKSYLDIIEDMRYPTPPSDAWWQQHARQFYPPQRKDSSIAFHKLVEEASPTPLFEIGKPWTKPADVPQEHFAFLPAWFVSTQVYRGQYGYWALDPPSQIIAHGAYHYTPGGSGLWKSYINKGYGWWHWNVSEAFDDGNVLGLPGTPKLLMLAPGVALYTKTEAEFRDTLFKFARLAEALGRRFVVPNPPCDSVWMGVFDNNHDDTHGFLPEDPQDKDIHVWPDRYDGMSVLQFPDLPRRKRGHKSATYCHWIRMLTKECVQAMPAHVDALAWMERSLAPGQRVPSEANTLWFTEWKAAGGEDGPATRAQHGQQREELRVAAAPAVKVPSGSAAVGEATKFGGAPVLFMGAVPHIESEEGLPPLPADFQQCYLYNQAQQGRPLDESGTTWNGRDNRQARLNGTASTTTSHPV